jgi:hypothetical protein
VRLVRQCARPGARSGQRLPSARPARVYAAREGHGNLRDRQRQVRQRAAIAAGLALGAPGACRSNMGVPTAASRAGSSAGGGGRFLVVGSQRAPRLCCACQRSEADIHRDTAPRVLGERGLQFGGVVQQAGAGDARSWLFRRE